MIGCLTKNVNNNKSVCGGIFPYMVTSKQSKEREREKEKKLKRVLLCCCRLCYCGGGGCGGIGFDRRWVWGGRQRWRRGWWRGGGAG